MTCHLPSQRSPGTPLQFFSSALRFFALATLSSALSLAVPAQDSSPAPQSPAATPASDSKSEISMHDSESTFKLHVNLVQVRVVVRDSSGKPVENLRREDFEIYDQGKLQTITSFDVDTPESRRERAAAALKTQASAAPSPDAAKVSIPERFMALVFDDAHLSGDDAARVRIAASKFLQGLLPSDRVAVYCTSGQCTPQEFTSDSNLLNKAIAGILPHPLLEPATGASAPQASYGPPTAAATFGAAADIDAILYAHLAETLRRLAAMPGQRVMLLISPGFGSNLTDATGFASAMSDASGIIGSANRSGIVINTLDARSLYAPGYLSPANQFTADPLVTSQVINGSNSAEFESPIVLKDFAAGTGGTFFQNSNDLSGGLARLGSTPEVSYLLGFSPQNQKTNGQFHLLKVKLVGNLKYDVQARRGYFAPSKVDEPKEQARAEIEDAIYSQGEIQDFPLELQTQYFTAEDASVRLSVVSRLGVKSMRFRKADDRNLNSVIIATAIFDENGDLITGGVKNVDMRLLDATLTRLSRTGLTVRSSFQLKPGKYLVRQVVRDSEGSQMAARNGVVSIPL
jgi:VWFA-related protein